MLQRSWDSKRAVGPKIRQAVLGEVFERGVCRAPDVEEAEEDILKEG